MQYKHLPPVGSVHLPELAWIPTAANSSRFGSRVNRIWVHRWGVKFTNEHDEALSYRGVIHEFKNPANKASSHVVFPGSAVPDRAAQMVAWSRKSWTEAFYNRTGISVESGDAIWLGADPVGFAGLARIVAFLVKDNDLPPNWIRGRIISVGRGFSRHADGGILAGGHTQCPTTDMPLWWQFLERVKSEYAYDHFGHGRVWGRR